MRRLLIFTAALLLYCFCTTAIADIYTWLDENGVRHYSNYAAPPQAKIIMKTEELPYDQQADNERMETERLDQLTVALQAVAEKEARLAEMQRAAERRIEEADRKAREALEQAESLLDQAEYKSYGHINSGLGYYPYQRSYYQQIYNRWYYRHGGSILYRKQHYKNRHKHDYKKKYRHKKRYDHRYRGDADDRRYKTRKNHLNRLSTNVRGGFGHRRSLGTRSFSLNP